MGIVTRSYEYNVLCDSCQFAFKASELRLRYDGLMVCPEDWEPRHPSDFYRPRNDSHKLPFIRSDDPADSTVTWSPTPLGFLSYSVATGESPTAPDCFYHVDALLGKTTGGGVMTQFVDSATGLLPLVFPESKTTSAGGTMTLPTTPTTGGRAVFRTNLRLLGTAVISAASASVTVPTWTSQVGNVTVFFSYGT